MLSAKINSLTPEGEAESWEFSSAYSVLRSEEDLWHLPAHVVISILPQVTTLCRTHQSSKPGNTEASPLGNLLRKVGVLGMQTNSSLPWEKLRAGKSSSFYGTTLGVGTLESPYWLP